MNLSDHPLLKPYIGKPALLDSNLLLLNWCAHFDPSLVRTFKGLNSFRLADFDLLNQVLKSFPLQRATPHVLTEVSNLTNSLPEWIKEDWTEYFSRQIQVMPKEWMPAAKIAEGDFMWFGLTDAAMASLAFTHVVFTMDFRLSESLRSRALNVINFTHLRAMLVE